MTNIYFCDVCNESVPQADLDLGRALVIKGRVICVICDRAMTQRAEARAQARPANLGLDLDLAMPASVAGSNPSAGHAAGASPGAHGGLLQTSGAHASTTPRQRESNGAGLAFLALVAAACGLLVIWNWARGEFARLDEEAVRATQLAVVEQTTARAELDRLAREVDQRARDAQSRLDAALEATQRSLATSGDQQGAQLRELSAKFGQIEARVAAVDEALARVARHDTELVGLSQRMTSATTDLGALAEQVRTLTEGGRNSVAEGAIAAPVAPPDVRPAWFELTTLLQSPSTADRWQGLIALGETADPACVPYVSPLLRDKDVFIRMAAARVLGDLGAPASVEPLIEALGDAELPVRESAADALRRVTKLRLDFDAQASEPERSKRVRQLREWWAKERAKQGGQESSRSEAR